MKLTRRTARNFNVRSDRGFIVQPETRFTTSFVAEADGAYRNVSDEDVIAEALRILSRQMLYTDVLANPRITRQYLAVRFAGLQHEVFACLYLNLCAALTNVHRRCRKTAVRQMSCALLNINAVPGPAAPTPGTFRCR